MHTQRRWLWTLLAALLLASLWTAQVSTVRAEEKSIVWDRFDVDITVNANGTFDVAEHQAIRFVDGTFTFGYRNIPKQNLSQLTNWSVTDASGNIYSQAAGGKEPYTFVVDDQGNEYVVRWYFPQTDTPETYTLNYTVNDGLRYYPEGDQLWWKAVYGDRQYPALASRVRVLVPAPAVIQKTGAYINGGDAGYRVESRQLDDQRAAIFDTTETLDAGEELEVRVEFTPNVVVGTAPYWQADADAEAARRAEAQAFQDQWAPVATVGLGALGLILLFAGPVLVYLLWYRVGRDKPVARVADYLPEAPDDLPPGLAGTLLDDTADMQDVIATIVDLARRKVLSITEEKQEGFWRSGTDFIYRRENKDTPLAPFEQDLVDSMFGLSGEEVRLSELKNKFYAHVDGIKKKMYADLVKRGYYRESPERARTTFGCAGAALLALAVGLGVFFFIFLIDFSVAALCPGFGLFVTALALVIAARFMPRKTDAGAEAAARWRAFREYLEHMEKYTDVAEQKEIWDRWLPYAIAFGFDKDYIRRFEGVDAPAPGWYIPSPTLYGPYRQRYYGWGPGPVIAAGGGSSGGGSDLGGDGGGLGGGLSDASRGLGSSLSSMSVGLGSLLSSASSTFASRPSSSGRRRRRLERGWRLRRRRWRGWRWRFRLRNCWKSLYTKQKGMSYGWCRENGRADLDDRQRGALSGLCRVGVYGPLFQ